MFAGLACCEMPSQYLQSAFQGLSGGPQRGQEQSATRTLRVHLLGIDHSSETGIGGVKTHQCKNLMYSKKGVVYKLHAGWFINRTPGEFINRGHFIKFKGFLCGNPTEKGESLVLNFRPPGSLYVQPRHRDCLPQARGFRTGKNTIHQLFTLKKRTDARGGESCPSKTWTYDDFLLKAITLDGLPSTLESSTGINFCFLELSNSKPSNVL